MAKNLKSRPRGKLPLALASVTLALLTAGILASRRTPASSALFARHDSVLLVGTLLTFLIAAAAGIIARRDDLARVRAEVALQDGDEKYRMLLNGVQDYAILMLDPSGKVVSWSAGAERIAGYKPEEIIGKNFSCFFLPEDIAASRPKELGQFANIASHDLQEPLRMVASYRQLLARRYKRKLDADADEFIAFAVDGASRMHRLIQDLIAYSRVATKGRGLQATSSEDVLERAIVNLRGGIEDSGAIVTHDALPSVLADDIQLVPLFQNLIGNAMKYQNPGIPRVHVSARKNGGVKCFPLLFALFRGLTSLVSKNGSHMIVRVVLTCRYPYRVAGLRPGNARQEKSVRFVAREQH